MKRLKLIICLFLFALCIAATAVGCQSSSSGSVIDKLPVDSNMPSPDTPSGGGDKVEHPDYGNGESGGNGGEDGSDKEPTPPPEETVENIVVFIAENFEYTVPYSLGDKTVKEPSVPEKRGYIGKWQSYDLQNGGKITVEAEYSLKEYEITFIWENGRQKTAYTIFDDTVNAPEIPEKKGYTAVWEQFELNYGEPLTVNAVYSVIYYKIYFPADGDSIVRTYTVENDKIDEPPVPHKTGFTGEWKYGALTFGEDMYAEAVYTPLPATSAQSFEWKLNENGDGYVITEYTGADHEVVIPSVYNDLPVTGIARQAFFANTELYGIIISENVTSIGNNAFSYCKNLTSAELPSTLREICAETFSQTGITEIALPKGLVKIGRKAFGESALTAIDIPDGVEEIGEYVFLNCKALKTAVIGDGVKIIPERAFAGCSALRSVKIGNGVENILKGAFSECVSLESAVFCDVTYWYERIDGVQADTPISNVQLENTAWAAHMLNCSVGEFYKTDE